VEFWAKSVKNFAQFLKIWANSLKIEAKVAHTVLDLQKWRPKSHEDYFLEVIKYRLHQKIFAQKVFSGRFGEIWAKILRTPNNLPIY